MLHINQGTNPWVKIHIENVTSHKYLYLLEQNSNNSNNISHNNNNTEFNSIFWPGNLEFQLKKMWFINCSKTCADHLPRPCLLALREDLKQKQDSPRSLKLVLPKASLIQFQCVIQQSLQCALLLHDSSEESRVRSFTSYCLNRSFPGGKDG